mgnify:CR=1 FL=1
MAERVGIVGVPPLAVIAELNRRGDLIVDLDEPQVAAPMDQTATRIPRVYCAILRTVVLNCLHLRLDRVYIDVGPGKCDGALHVAEVLADMLEVPEPLDQGLRQGGQTGADFHHRLRGLGVDGIHNGSDHGLIAQEMLPEPLACNVLHCGAPRIST